MFWLSKKGDIILIKTNETFIMEHNMELPSHFSLQFQKSLKSTDVQIEHSTRKRDRTQNVF